MSKADQAAEPSMDEILSSIRKIIAEDEIEAAETAPVADLEGSDADDEDGGDDDILDLTIDDEESAPAGLEAAIVDDVEDATPEIADLDDAVEPAPEIDVTPGETEALAAPEPSEALAEVGDVMIDDEPVVPAAMEVEAPAAATAMDDMADALLATGTAAAAGGALQRLSAAMAPGEAIPSGNRSIETFLADLVRPELKGWLDLHLPALVERIVEREIKRLVRDAQPE